MRGAEIRLKLKLSLCFLLILLLSSCSSDNAEELKGALSSVTSAEYTAHITASFPDREAEYTISYTQSPEKVRASVISPKEVAGVSYTISGDEGFLEFDGAILEIGKLDDSGISPFSCIYSLQNSWKNADFEEITRDTMYGKRAYFAISREMTDTSETEYRTWFSEDGFLPLYSEIFSDGKRIIMCEFERAEHKIQ